MTLNVRGGVVHIDDADLPLVSGYTWHLIPGRRTKYATTCVDQKTVYMHRLLMGSIKGQQVDHINGNGLDNRRANLRHATNSENQRNIAYRVHPSRKSSQYKGVTWCKQTGQWRAQLSLPGKKALNSPRFACEVDAATWYNETARMHFGEFARLNALPGAA